MVSHLFCDEAAERLRQPIRHGWFRGFPGLKNETGGTQPSSAQDDNAWLGTWFVSGCPGDIELPARALIGPDHVSPDDVT